MALFSNRTQAGQRLAEHLAEYSKQANTIVLALPRGGVPVAYEVARKLQLPLDVFIVRKLGVPMQEELALGAIALGDVCIFNEEIQQMIPMSQAELDRIIAREQAEIARRNIKYRNNKALPSLKDKTVILIDDGLATGATMRAAIAAIKQFEPANLVVAVPVAARSVCYALKQQVDKIICLEQPEPFYGVGMWYADFDQTTDEEVIQLLQLSEQKTQVKT